MCVKGDRFLCKGICKVIEVFCVEEIVMLI